MRNAEWGMENKRENKDAVNATQAGKSALRSFFVPHSSFFIVYGTSTLSNTRWTTFSARTSSASAS
jgi:hypothetical protein